MAVLIRDPEADRLIRELAARSGETITDAVRTAVQQRLSRLPAKKGRIDRALLAEAQAYFRSLPVQNEGVSDEEIVGFNDEGHFG